MSKVSIRLTSVVIWLLSLFILIFLRIGFSFDRNPITITGYLVVDLFCIYLSILPIVNVGLATALQRWPKWKTALVFLYAFLICKLHQLLVWWWLSPRLLTKLSAKEYQDVNSTYHSLLFQVFDTYMIIGLAVLGAYAYVFYRNLIQERINRQLLEKENIKAELNYLKSQINPHFLFNSINLIFGYIDKSNQEARDTLLRFSDILRYQLYETNVPGIKVEKEVAYLRNYIALQRMRKNEKLTIHMSIEETVRDFEIAPLLLIFFVENSFKHISSHEALPNYIHIELTYQSGLFRFRCENSVDPVREKPSFSDSGIGIRNVSRRLELLYPSLHRLTIGAQADKYTVDLELNLNPTKKELN